MFSHAFQGGGLGVEIFSSSGKDPAKLWKCTRNVHRVYDRTVKGFVFLLEKGTATQMSIPPEPSRESLGLVQPVLVMQLRLSPSKHTSLEIIVLDNKGNKRRMHLSSTFREFECNDLHIQIPLRFEKEDRWVNLVLDLDEIIGNCFRGHKFQSIMYICIKPVCRLRKVFTLFQADRHSRLSIPAMYEFPTGTNYTNIYYPERSEHPMARTPTVEEIALPPPPSHDSQSTISAPIPGLEANKVSKQFPPKVVDESTTRTAAVQGSTVPATAYMPAPSPGEAEKASRALKLLKKAKEDKEMARIANMAPPTAGSETIRSVPAVEIAPITDDTNELHAVGSVAAHVREVSSNKLVVQVAGPEDVAQCPGQGVSPLMLQQPHSLGSKASVADCFFSTRSPHTPLLREVPPNYTPKLRPPTVLSPERAPLSVVAGHVRTGVEGNVSDNTALFCLVNETSSDNPEKNAATSLLMQQPQLSTGSKPSIADNFQNNRSPYTPLLREVPANTSKSRPLPETTPEVAINPEREHFPTSPDVRPHVNTVLKFVDIAEACTFHNAPQHQSTQDIPSEATPRDIRADIEAGIPSPNGVNVEETMSPQQAFLTEKTIMALGRELESLQLQFIEEYGEAAFVALNNR